MSDGHGTRLVWLVQRLSPYFLQTFIHPQRPVRRKVHFRPTMTGALTTSSSRLLELHLHDRHLRLAIAGLLIKTKPSSISVGGEYSPKISGAQSLNVNQTTFIASERERKKGEPPAFRKIYSQTVIMGAGLCLGSKIFQRPKRGPLPCSRSLMTWRNEMRF